MDKKVRKKFECRHCGKLVYVDGILHTHPGERRTLGSMSQGGDIGSFVCSECGKINLFLTTKHYGNDGKETTAVRGRILDKYIYPVTDAPKTIKHVPAKYMKEYNEASWVKEISPKSCALVCRRILEMILENECSCTKFNLSEKVNEYITGGSVPKLVETSMRFIIGAGNATAHDKKDQNDDLICIKPADCEKLLEALRTVFDYIFVRPEKEKEMDKQVQKVTPKREKVKI